MREPVGGPKYNLRPTSTNSVRSNPLASIPDHPNPTLMTVALTVTFQGRELLPTISVTYVVIPVLPGPPFLLHYFSNLTLPSSGGSGQRKISVARMWPGLKCPGGILQLIRRKMGVTLGHGH